MLGMRIVFSTLLMVGSVGAASCSSTSPTQACTDMVHATCSLRDTCSTNSYENVHLYGSELICEQRSVAECVSALNAKDTGQTPAHIEGCVTAYASYGCSDFYDNNPPGPCLPPAGTGAMDSPCGGNAQCTSTFCAVSEFQVCGTCQPLPVVGASCQVNVDCGRDLVCAIPANATAGTCAAWVASGGMCLTGSMPCQATLACVGDNVTSGTKGTCQTQGATVGAACDGTRATAPNCNGDLGLVCIPKAAGSAVGTCQPFTLVAAGATCGDIGSAPITGFAVCQAGAECIKTVVTATTGTCMAPAADGSPCDNDPTKGPPCLPPAKCVTTSSSGTAGTCTQPAAATCM